ncbi:YihY/virulence factor BrkB family protein [uncultured Sulfitobacter sp.]|uniref:YihY/virulence factor BrkB family protein n=1 Tax=uncultured Sulfitobacter sp. TaxID=191468 RepID=UPI00262A063B|nr:YihY/virulence factor BrkB family protein [uncultured Sulfitobacter sp.]
MHTPPPQTYVAQYWQALKSTVTHISDNNISLVSAGVAFFVMLSLFPALAAFIALLGLILDPVVVLAQLEELRGLLPADVYDIINTQITSLVTARSDTLGWAGALSILFALWSARAGVGALMVGLNEVYNTKNRSAAYHYLRALMLTIILVVVGIVALITQVVTPVLLAFFPLGTFSTLIIDVLRWGITIAVLLGATGMLYRYGANRRGQAFQWLSPGALLAIGLWVVVSIGFSYYVANFGNYNEVYGSIGAVIAMLIWLWISSFLVLIGGSLNAQLDLQRSKARSAQDNQP